MNLPNLLTGARMLLTPVVVWRLATGDCRGALVFLALAGFTDAADGYIARRFDQITRAGAYLDPIADKLMLTAVFLTLGWLAVVPRWLVWLIVGRDLVILGMAGAGLAFTAHRNFPPSIWGKLSTVVQIATALAGVSACAASFGMPVWLIWLTAAATAWSGVHYVLRALRLAASEEPRG